MPLLYVADLFKIYYNASTYFIKYLLDTLNIP